VPQEQQKESLGSLSSIGEVYVNDSAAPVESTIFSGDRLRTGESGTATFTVSGKGTLKVLPRSEVVFPGNYQFTAELKNGTVVLSSVSGPRGIALRVENFVLVSSIREQSATTKIEGRQMVLSSFRAWKAAWGSLPWRGSPDNFSRQVSL